MWTNGILSKILSRHPEIKNQLTRMDLLPGVVMARSDEPIDHVIFPASGMISTAVALAEDFIDAGMVGSEGAVGGGVVFGASTHLSAALCVFPGTAFTLPASSLVDLSKRDEPVRKVLFAFQCWLLVQAQQIALCNARHTLTRRLSRWLLQAEEVNGGRHLPATQELIAHLLGATRASISIVAGKLHDRGCIDYKRGLISIVDHERLETEACGCHAKLKQHRFELLTSAA